MSNVDVTVPVEGSPTTASVRSNFSTIKTELEALDAGSAVQAGNLAALKAAPTAAKAAVLACRFVLDEGGGGLFRWDSSDLSTEVTNDARAALYVSPNSDATGASGAWVRIVDGPYNALWWRNSAEVDLSAIVAAAVTTLNSINAGQAVRPLYLPNRPEATPGGSNEQWEWSAQVSLEDPSGVQENGFHVWGDPVWIKCTADIASLYRTGYYKKARKTTISDHHVDINGHTLTAFAIHGEAQYAIDHHIEVADGLGTGSCQYVVKCDDGISNEGAGSGEGISFSHFYHLWDSGSGAIKAANFYANKMTNSVVEFLNVSKSSTYGAVFQSSAGSIQSNTVRDLFSVGGVATNTAMVRLDEAGSSIQFNHFEMAAGNTLVDYGVSMNFASGLIRRNVFNIPEYGWGTAAFDSYDDGNNILENTYLGEYHGSYTGTLTGCTTSPTGAIKYTRKGKLVIVEVPDLTATSNATTMTITGGPPDLRPINTTPWMPCRISDNGTVSLGIVRMNTSGALDFRVNAAAGTFTATGTKGSQSTVVTYMID